MRGLSLNNYCEDEEGNEISMGAIGRILTGNPNTILIPSGAKQHDLEYMFSKKTPVPLIEVALSTDEIRLLGYFVRDLEELKESALMKEGAGSITTGGHLSNLVNGDYHYQTAVNNEEIRSFLMIFRRLYMENEPANVVKAVELFERALGGHPRGRWAHAVVDEYLSNLQQSPEVRPFLPSNTVAFTRKRLIDVFLYTQFAHQPNTTRQRQFTECLAQVGERRNFLTWLFLREVWSCGLKVTSAGNVIAEWFEAYCRHFKITPDILNSLMTVHEGLGVVEKSEARKVRLFREKVEEIEIELWKQAGCPAGGPIRFRHIAESRLRDALDD